MFTDAITRVRAAIKRISDRAIELRDSGAAAVEDLDKAREGIAQIVKEIEDLADELAPQEETQE